MSACPNNDSTLASSFSCLAQPLQQSMSSIPQFQHRSLYSAGKSIRLIKLLRNGQASDDEGAIECELELSYLQSSIPIYDAVSYSWADEKRTANITINGALFKVTPSVQDVLRQIRLPDTDRLLWIDLICIDQDNAEEKASQVQRMKDIFGQARSVIVSLGPHHVDGYHKSARQLKPRLDILKQSSSSPNLLKQGVLKKEAPFLLRSKQEAFKLLDSQWAALRTRLHWTWNRTDENNLLALLNHRWFTRVWVVQEVHAAKEVVIICGDSSIDGKHIGKLCDPDLQDEIKSDKIKQKLKKMSPLLEYMCKSPPSRREDFPELLTVLQRFRHLSATLPHDKIFALLAMSRDGTSEESLQPNYTISVTKLYQNVAKYMILRYREPTLLTYLGPIITQQAAARTRMSLLHDKEHLLPSWCPDWRGLQYQDPQIVESPNLEPHDRSLWFFVDQESRLVLKVMGLSIAYVASVISDGVFDVSSPWLGKGALTDEGTKLHRIHMHLQRVHGSRKKHGLDIQQRDQICLFLDSSGVAIIRPIGKRYALLLLEHSTISRTVRRSIRNGPLSSTATSYPGDNTYDPFVQDMISWITKHDKDSRRLVEQFDIE